ncbi:homoserine O-succinyltransferase, partial [Gordonia sp. (in: high G+C Gram-positive bacteria)]
MPVNIPRDLPARATLESEGIFVMSDERARSQDIRPMRIA